MSAIADAPTVELMSQDDLLRAIDELSRPLGFGPGEFVPAARSGEVADSTATSRLLVLLPLLDD